MPTSIWMDRILSRIDFEFEDEIFECEGVDSVMAWNDCNCYVECQAWINVVT